MGNHCIDCRYCGKCSRCEGCDSDCPGDAYERAMNDWRRAQREAVEKAIEPLRNILREAEEAAAHMYKELNPPPPEPKRVM